MLTPEVEGLIRREVQRQVQQAGGMSSGNTFSADDYDIRVDAANQYPGRGWTFVEAVMIGPGLVGIVWRKLRTAIAAEGGEPVMKTASAK